jgi:nucleoside-diphosphate-sugar epimerase
MARLRLLVTGSEGLIGSAVCGALEKRGDAVVRFDPRGASGGDTRDAEAVAEAIDGCDGVLHLGAVSRVVWGEDDPETTRAVNVGGTQNVLEAATHAGAFVLFASSREVYGHRDATPTGEGAPLAPLNVYAHTKVDGEAMVERARQSGANASVVRYSGVYGGLDDHADRVVPAFARRALAGDVLRVDGRGHTFDFVWLDDAVRGTLAMLDRLADGAPFAPIQLVSGHGTSLQALAELACRAAATDASWREAPPRSYDVSCFVGDPQRAAAELDWRATVSIEEGMARYVRALARR